MALAENFDQAQTGDVLWTPSPERIAASKMREFQEWLAETRGVPVGDFASLHAWSVENLGDFWDAVWEFFDVIGDRADSPAVVGSMPHARWYAGAQINYAENMLRWADHMPDDEALMGLDEGLDRRALTWAELAGQVGALAQWLRSSGVGEGDVVCAVLPNIPQAVVGLLASASVGAIWSVVGAEFGSAGVLDRFVQLEPKVLLTADGYRFNGKQIDLRPSAASLLEQMPSVQTHVLVDNLGDRLPAADPVDLRVPSVVFSDIVAAPQKPEFARVEFSHPLWVVFSSGTTGKPKGIVHGHGGIVLEAAKTVLHSELKLGLLAYTAVSPTWIMWNILVNSLGAGVGIVVYDGSPVAGSASRHFEIVSREKANHFATGAAILQMMEKAAAKPRAEYDLSSLRTILSTGSPLPGSTWKWTYEFVAPNIRVGSDSGGTDICTAFIGSNPLNPVVLGQLQGPYLGVAADAFDAHGNSVVGELAEFVVTKPMPSMPVKFWNDPDGSRYRDAYFDVYPGVWRHGDWVTRSADDRWVIHGRSDSTINRGGIRMGSSDITNAVNRVEGVQASMVIGAELGDGDYYLPLFVVTAPGVELDEQLRSQIVQTIRSEVSPRHVPDEIIAAPGVPMTRTGKLLEVPLKKVFQGQSPDVVNRSTAADSEILDWYLNFASRFAEGAADQETDSKG